MKYLTPVIPNAVRELSKGMDWANKAAFLKCMKHKMCLAQKFGLTVKPNGNENEPWNIECFCDSGYVGVPDTRRSTSGLIMYVLGIPVSWRLKILRSMTL